MRLKQPPPSEAGNLLPREETPCFPIRRIVLNNAYGQPADPRYETALTAANPVADPTIGRCLGAAGINRVMARIQNAVIAQGEITTRILAPTQDLKSGVLTLTVLPGHIRETRLTADSSPQATLWNALPFKDGALLNLRDIEQGLENLKRVPTADADIQIVPSAAPGAKPGESDLVIRWRQTQPVRFSLSTDDSGTKATGKNLASATLSLDNAARLNDLFYLTWMQDLGGSSPGARGTHGYVAHYSLPYGYWQLGFTASYNTYNQAVAGTTQTYRYSGESSNREIRLSRVFYRDAVRKSTLSIKGWLRTSNNFIDDTEVQVQRRRMAGWELGLTHRENLASATLVANLAYRRGTNALGALPAPEEAFGEGTARPSFFTADAQITLPFQLASQSLRYSGAWRGQWNRSTLVPQDRFAIGGRYTVRGFDGESILSAERGWLLRNDIGLALGASGVELYLGMDRGEVSGPSSRALVGKRLTGAIVGIRGAYKSCSYDFFVGQPINKPDGFQTATTTGFSLNWSI